MTKELIQSEYPMASLTQINIILKYQGKFNLTLENLKCINPNCKNIKKWFNTAHGFSHTCGDPDCKEKTKALRYNIGTEKAKDTFMTKYGVSNPSRSEEVKKAKKATCLQNSGFEHNMQNPEHIKMREARSLEFYGVTNPSKLESVKQTLKNTKQKRTPDDRKKSLQKFQKTCFLKFGVSNPSQAEEIKQKVRETNFKNFGVSYPFLHPLIKKQILDNRFRITGYLNPFSNPKIKKQIQDYYFTNFNRSSSSNLHITNYQFWNDKTFWEQNFLLEDLSIDYKKRILFFNCSISNFFQKINLLGINYNKKVGYSLSEKEISQFIKEQLNIQICENQRFSHINELDIYIPDHKIAIEYNGIYWHSYMHHDQAISEKQIDLQYCKKRHLDKTNACQKEGIQLFHIFENEWMNETKRTIWKSVLENALGQSKRLGARKCVLKPVPKREIRPFLEQNHLQGYGTSPIAYGLYYNDELVSIMTFASGKGRMDKNTDWELIRFCNKIGYNVQGAASRLLKAFRKDHAGSIKSYANRRWSNGNLYRQLGFKEIGISEPNFFYWHKSNPNVLLARQYLQKHKLKSKLENYDPKLTAFKNITNAGYNVIWDSGNYIFLLEKEE